jgi:hypothetical protein
MRASQKISGKLKSNSLQRASVWINKFLMLNL